MTFLSQNLFAKFVSLICDCVFPFIDPNDWSSSLPPKPRGCKKYFHSAFMKTLLMWFYCVLSITGRERGRRCAFRRRLQALMLKPKQFAERRAPLSCFTARHTKLLCVSVETGGLLITPLSFPGFLFSLPPSVLSSSLPLARLTGDEPSASGPVGPVGTGGWYWWVLNPQWFCRSQSSGQALHCGLFRYGHKVTAGKGG